MDTEPAPHLHWRAPTTGGPTNHLHVEGITHDTPGVDHEGFMVHGARDEAHTRRMLADHPCVRAGKTIITLRRAEDGCFYGLFGNL